MTSAAASDPAGMPSARPPLGAPVLGRFTKWGEGRHWEWVGRYLGSDEHGDWWFAPPGTRCTRPGLDFVEVGLTRLSEAHSQEPFRRS